MLVSPSFAVAPAAGWKLELGWTKRPEKKGRNDALFEAAAGEPGDALADCLVLEDFDAQLMRPELGARDPDRMATEGGEEGRIHDESADAGGYLQSFELYETQSVRKTR